jgi:phage shock protein B
MGVSIVALTPAFIILAVAVMLAVIFHYRHKARLISYEARREDASVAELRDLAATLERRMVTLERILDAEAPGWRERERT